MIIKVNFKDFYDDFVKFLRDRMMNCDIITHPSVRIRGTETDYTPKECCDPQCGVKDQLGHMHCPFCAKTGIYHDVVILRAHYRVKHVDKSIDFAGLKILRCCAQCDIVGAIKGEKKFKGAHWHCYKCKNGFNRRDEAIKHYKTHFRNPLTTFQIHITQEVNGPFQQYGTVNFVPVGVGSHSVDEESANNESSLEMINVTKCFGNELDSCVDASDEADGGEMLLNAAGEEEPEAIMIIQEAAAMNGGMETAFNHCSNLTNSVSVIGKEVDFVCSDDEKELKQKLYELQRENEDLRLKNEQLGQHYKDEIAQLQIQVALYAKELESLKMREQDLIRHLMGDSCDLQSQDLLASLQAQHTELLQHHMLQVHMMTMMQQHTVDNDASFDKDISANESSNVVALIVNGQGTLLTPTKISLMTQDDDDDSSKYPNTNVELSGNDSSTVSS